METIQKAAKVNRISQKPKGLETMRPLINDSAKAILVAGKTLWEVGQLFGLGDEDLKLETNKRTRKDGTEFIINELSLRIDGQKYSVNFSKGFDITAIGDKSKIDWLLSCEFRAGYNYLVDEEGITVEKDGVKQFDMNRPFLNFGKPSGIVSQESTALFAPLTEEEIAAIATNA